MRSFSSFSLSLLTAFNSSLAHLSQGQRMKWRISRHFRWKLPNLLKTDEFTSAEKHTHTHREKKRREMMCCCFPSRSPSLASAPWEPEAKWWGFGAGCSAGTISHVVRAPAGPHICLQLSASRSHHYSRRANQTHVVTSVKWLELSLKCGHFPHRGGPEARKGAHTNRAYRCCMCKSRHM